MTTLLTNAEHTKTIVDSSVWIGAKHAVRVQPAVIHAAHAS